MVAIQGREHPCDSFATLADSMQEIVTFLVCFKHHYSLPPQYYGMSIIKSISRQQLSYQLTLSVFY